MKNIIINTKDIEAIQILYDDKNKKWIVFKIATFKWDDPKIKFIAGESPANIKREEIIYINNNEE